MLFKLVYVVLSSALYVSAARLELLNSLSDINPDVGLRVPALVAKHGYPLETHTVVTEDGYILDMHRIPHGKDDNASENRPVVFLMHGLLCSSADWVLMGPEKGLGYLLADRGYDVWMGNARGNYYSRKHVNMDPNTNHSFWLFSWHEIGFYDLPTMIDFTLNHTGESQISYIGHSQGTTSFFVLTSSRPEYNDKIRLMMALAPVAYMSHNPNLSLRIISKFQHILQWITDFIGMYEFLPSTKFMQLLGQFTCNDNSLFQPICSNILFLIAGYDSKQLNVSTIPVILSNTPAGSSTRQLLHYAQEINNGNFQQYDFGKDENIKRYGTKEPPLYAIKNITAPIILYYGNNDKLTSPTDVEKLREELPHPVLKYKVKYPAWTHLDFLWSIDVVELLYNHMFDMLERFS